MQHSDRGISKTFVLVSDKSKTTIFGYFTLTICEVRFDSLTEEDSKKLPKTHPVPAGKLARLAVSSLHQKKGYGEQLLVSAMEHFLQAHDVVGMSALFVDAKDENAVAFYKKYDFVPSSDNPMCLYMPVQTIRAAFQ